LFEHWTPNCIVFTGGNTFMVFQRILFPVDFSDQCSQIAPEVQAVAQHFKAEVILLHAFEVPPVWYGEIDAASFSTLVDVPALHAERVRRLEEWRATHLPQTAAQCIVNDGEAGRVIVEVAKTEKAGLVMIPTRGYGPFRRALLGSVTAKVLHDVECPVWTAAHTESINSRPPGQWRRIIAAVDLTERSIPVLEWASRLAKDFEASLTIAHVAFHTEIAPHKYLEAVRTLAEQKAIERIMELQQSTGTNAPLCVTFGQDIAASVCEIAKQNETDLIVIGRGHLSAALGRLRSNVYSIIRKSPCPVLSV
jgi:nucleotide-binding universal stress UspA family protein